MNPTERRSWRPSGRLRRAFGAALAGGLLSLAPRARADTWGQVSVAGLDASTAASGNAELSRGTTFFDGAATYVYFGVGNSTAGAQVWRSSDGASWNRANTPGFDASGASNTAVAWLSEKS